jgi:hypothetical protein
MHVQRCSAVRSPDASRGRGVAERYTAGVTGTLLYEVRPPGTGKWITLGTLSPAADAGSITDMAGGRRDILLFRCEGERSVISRSAGGIDFDAGETRAVAPLEGLETLAELGDGQVYERDVVSDSGREYRARWTHRGHPDVSDTQECEGRSPSLSSPAVP